jgi:thiol-disulfide isomerase/thioredoxin
MTFPSISSVRRIVVAAALAMTIGLVSLSARAKAAELKIGDPAPPLAPSEWVKGEPVKQFEPGKTYVVEFWATWCGPCIQAIPHLSRMQEEYKDKDVIFIGQDVWEQDQSKVKPFVEKMGDKMNYRVAMDNVADGGRGKMAETWLAAAGQEGIPASFVVDKQGKIAWIGHPMALEPVLKQVVAGTFDPKKAANADAAKQEIGQRYMTAVQGKNWDGALAALEEIEQADPSVADQLIGERFNLYLQKKDYDNAYKQAELAGRAYNDNAEALNAVAWTIVDMPGIERRDYDLAQKLAERAVEVTKGEEPAVLDTLAHVHYEKKDLDKAIEYQQKAVEKAEEPMKSELQQTLEKYKAEKK